MYMADESGAISSVNYAPGQRTRIQTDTCRAMFVVYAPAEVRPLQIENHFSDIQAYIQLFAPTSKPVFQKIF